MVYTFGICVWLNSFQDILQNYFINLPSNLMNITQLVARRPNLAVIVFSRWHRFIHTFMSYPTLFIPEQKVLCFNKRKLKHANNKALRERGSTFCLSRSSYVSLCASKQKHFLLIAERENEKISWLLPYSIHLKPTGSVCLHTLTYKSNKLLSSIIQIVLIPKPTMSHSLGCQIYIFILVQLAM